MEREEKKAREKKEQVECVAAKKKASAQKTTTKPQTHRGALSGNATQDMIESDPAQLEVGLVEYMIFHATHIFPGINHVCACEAI